MRDEEIVKALECCSLYDGYACKICPIDFKDCSNGHLEKFALDLINRQKETIEQLKTALFKCGEEMAEKQATISRRMDEIDMMFTKFETIAAEAVKEFAEKVKEKIRTMSRIVVYDEDIDNLVKEFTEEQK